MLLLGHFWCPHAWNIFFFKEIFKKSLSSTNLTTSFFSGTFQNDPQIETRGPKRKRPLPEDARPRAKAGTEAESRARCPEPGSVQGKDCALNLSLQLFYSILVRYVCAFVSIAIGSKFNTFSLFFYTFSLFLFRVRTPLICSPPPSVVLKWSPVPLKLTQLSSFFQFKLWGYLMGSILIGVAGVAIYRYNKYF